MEKNKKLIQMFIAFFLYFLYSYYAISIGQVIGIKNDVITMFISDVIFLIFIIFLYREELKEDIKNLHKKYSFGKIVKVILFWVFVLFILNIVMGALTDLFVPGFESDNNTNALYNMSKAYMIFKTLIFGVIAEEILYRETIRTVVHNKYLFIITSALVYTFMNFVFLGFPEKNVIANISLYFIPAIFFSIAYIKNNSNILVLMLIKFTYNLIPLTILLLGI